jgi:hypothetical protein
MAALPAHSAAMYEEFKANRSFRPANSQNCGRVDPPKGLPVQARWHMQQRNKGQKVDQSKIYKCS